MSSTMLLSRTSTAAAMRAARATPTLAAAARRASSTLGGAAAAAAAAVAVAPIASSSSAGAVVAANRAAASLSNAIAAALRAREAQAQAYTAACAAVSTPAVSASSTTLLSSATPTAPAAAAVAGEGAAPMPEAVVRVSAAQRRRAERCAARHAARRMAAEGSDSSATPTGGAAVPPPPTAAPTAPSSSSTAAADESGSGPRLHPGIATRDLKPSQLVRELDRFIIGQGAAKKAVAIALRNRWRRHKLPEELRNEVTPKNILMIGPTGCGKTEIARRLARLTESPFIKVEATKFTEVGFHGKDVDSIVQDLVRVAINGLKVRRKAEARAAIQRAVQDKILEALTAGGSSAETFRAALESGALEGIEIEIEVPLRDPSASADSDEKGNSAAAAKQREAEMFQQFALRIARSLSGKRTEVRKLTIREARPLLEEAHMDTLYRPEDLVKEALKEVSQDGIVFIDEIDKICTGKSEPSHADASAEGVQRDLLPLLEGTVVTTKQGDVKTDHILFIASGAFHAVKPADLMAELQGRLPIRVELAALTEEELYRILTETENNLCQQQVELLAVDKVDLRWQDDAKREIARVACEVNRSVENIGARRLATVIERIVDDLSYSASDVPPGTAYVIDAAFVRAKVAPMLKTADLRKFIL